MVAHTDGDPAVVPWSSAIMDVIAIVTLHGASNEPYSTLHFGMATAHFNREILATDGKKYDLQHSVYVSGAYTDLATAQYAAKAAANAAWLSNDVMTIEASAIMWNGLRETAAYPNYLAELLRGVLK